MTTKKPRGPLRVVAPGERPPLQRRREGLRFKSMSSAIPGWFAWFMDPEDFEGPPIALAIAASERRGDRLGLLDAGNEEKGQGKQPKAQAPPAGPRE